MAKPVPDKLNPAWEAAVKHMLARPPVPKASVKKDVKKPPSHQKRPESLNLR